MAPIKVILNFKPRSVSCVEIKLTHQKKIHKEPNQVLPTLIIFTLIYIYPFYFDIVVWEFHLKGEAVNEHSSVLAPVIAP